MTERKSILKKSWDFYVRIAHHDVFGLAAQLSYFFLLSLFPLLITIFSILPFLPINEDHIIYFLQDFAPGETLQFIHDNLKELMSNHDRSVLSFGIIATLVSASTGMNAIIKAINRAYDVKENRHFLIVRGLSIVFTIIMIFVFLVGLLLPVFGKHLGIIIFSKLGFTEAFLEVWEMLRWVISSIILFIVFCALYLITPNKKVQCLTVIPGAIFSTIGWFAVSLGFSFYVNNFGHYTLTYGGLGVIIVLMIWFYLSGIILLVGGEINAVYNQWKKRK